MSSVLQSIPPCVLVGNFYYRHNWITISVEDIYDEDTYESKSSLVKKGADLIIIDETLKLLKDIK